MNGITSRHASRPLRVAATLLATCLLLLPALTPAQEAGDINTYLDLIEAREAVGGTYDPGLVEPLVSLGILYREQRRFDQAFEQLQRAHQVLRVSAGLDSVEEVRVLEELLRTAELRGNLQQVHEYEEALLSVAQKHVGNPVTWPVFVALADKRMALLNVYLQGQRPPEIFLGCYYQKDLDFTALAAGITPGLKKPQPSAACGAGDRDVLQRALLIEAIAYQGWALEALLQNGGYASDDMLALMHAFFRSSDQLNRVLSRGSEFYIRSVWNRVVNFPATTDAERVRRAQMQILLADLNLLRMGREQYFDEYHVLYSQYHQAYQSLLEVGAGEAELAWLYTPELPVHLPVHQTDPFVSTDTFFDGAYIDLSLDVDERGKARRFRILDSSSVSRDARRELQNVIRNSRFRPRLVEGLKAERATYVVRYPVGAQALRSLRAPVVVAGLELR